MKTFEVLCSDIKYFMQNEVSRNFLCTVILVSALGIWMHYEIKSVKTEIIKTRKRIDYRYFNMTNSLEDIYNIKIDTKNGEIKR